MVKQVKSRKFSLLTSWAILTVVLGVLAVTFFFEIYEVRSPIVKKQKILVSPLSDKKEDKKSSFLPKVEEVFAESPAQVPQNNTEWELSALQKEVLGYFPKEEHEAVLDLLQRESSWNPLAVNQSSGACGLFQALPCAKMACDDLENINCQALWGSAYIKARYGTAQKAIAFHDQKGWY